ncbi:MAG: hypothetical protein RR557_08805 [Bacilli bacterium]
MSLIILDILNNKKTKAFYYVSHISIVLVIFSISYNAQGQEEINIRDKISWNEGSSLEFGPICSNAGGVSTYLIASSSVDLKVGICHFWRENISNKVSYRQEFSYITVPKGNKQKIYIGCQVPGLNTFKLAWSDVDTGYTPSNLTNPYSALVLERIKHLPEMYMLGNRHKHKDIIVSYKLTGYNGHKTLKPGDLELVRSVINAKYVSDYFTPGPGSDCN